MNETASLENLLGVKFTDSHLLQTALTHRSFINETVEPFSEHNERLEFLGDAVLEIIVSEYLFHKFRYLREGDLTSFRSASVKMETLSSVATKIDLGKYIFMSKGEEMTGGRSRPYILANTFEALLGAMFVDQGINVCKEFLKKFFFRKINTIIKNKEYIDSKSKLQELTQEKYKLMPSYKIISEIGPDHNKTFTVEVSIKDSILGKGTGKTKQQAQQEAAKSALKSLHII